MKTHTKYPDFIKRCSYVKVGARGTDDTIVLARKWNSSDPQAIQHLSVELKDTKSTQELPTADEYMKTLGIQWNAPKDCFKHSVTPPIPLDTLTKRGLISEVSKTFDTLGWYSPSTMKARLSYSSSGNSKPVP